MASNHYSLLANLYFDPFEIDQLINETGSDDAA